MKRLLNSIIPAFLKTLVRRYAVNLCPTNFTSMEWCFANLRNSDFSPSTIIDIGAYTGDWTRMIKRIYPESCILMVEPQYDKESSLRRVQSDLGESVKYVNYLLGSSNANTVPFFEMKSGSSVFEEHSIVKRNKTLRQTRTLDSIVSELELEQIKLLKLDVQGYEIEVLKGAQETLKEVEIILLEAALKELNRGAPLLHDVISFMKTNSFIAYDICSFHRTGKDRSIGQVDIMFVSEDSNLLLFESKLSYCNTTAP